MRVLRVYFGIWDESFDICEKHPPILPNLLQRKANERGHSAMTWRTNTGVTKLFADLDFIYVTDLGSDDRDPFMQLVPIEWMMFDGDPIHQ